MQLNDRVVIYDWVSGTTNITWIMPTADWRLVPSGIELLRHSTEYDVRTNSVRSITVFSDFWCSSGSLMPDGTLIQTGVSGNSELVVCVYKTCDCNYKWHEIPFGFQVKQWYSRNHILPDGRQAIIGGREAYNYEFYLNLVPKVFCF
ncbi:hypothetical protein L2E82_34460 [Cichorium intybus]|uniref:Uncharacterized protein n=1 Tax=Cichorium intybus TaxID=13427 RepID=A0ACB9BM58_CICIN|nr:hypothetical protein L2E82_34460 [Cichorium intybus]